MKRKVCIATGTRADWGLLSNIAKVLDSRSDIELQIIATNMHLSPEFGNTYKEIEADGLKISYKVPVETGDDTAYGTVKSMSVIMTGFAKAFETLKPDILVILGDRYEMLVAALNLRRYGIECSRMKSNLYGIFIYFHPYILFYFFFWQQGYIIYIIYSYCPGI